MSILCISVLNPYIITCLLEEKKQSTSTFSSIDSFLKSELWEKHKRTPRVLYADNKESSHTLLDLTPLSWIEKKALFLQKFLRNNTPMVLLHPRQLISLDTMIPKPLIEGPVLKRTSTLLELLKIALRKNGKSYSLFYFHQKNAGVWQIALHNQTLLFHHFASKPKDPSLSNTLEIGRLYFSQQKIKQPIPIIDLAPFLKIGKEGPNSSFLMFNPIKALVIARMFLPSYSLIIQLALIVFLGLLLIHNKISIASWEMQTKLSRKNLNYIEEKMKSPSYQRLMRYFKDQKNSDV